MPATSLARLPDILAPAAELPADRHPLAVYVASLASDHSRRSATDGARRALAALLSRDRREFDAQALRRFPWQELRYQHVAAVRSQLLATGAAPSTINVTLSHLRAIVREAWRLGHVTAEEHARVRDVKNVKAEVLPAGRALSAGEVAALFAVCQADPTPAGPRDAALLALLYAAGMRRSEAVALRLEDVNPETGELMIKRGKGRKDRTCWLDNGALAALRAWLEVRGGSPGPLLYRVLKSGRVVLKGMTDQAALYVLQRRAEQAGVAHCSPHDLRRTFISDLLDAGADIATVKKMAGHANVSTTERYDRRPEETKRKAAALLHVPYASP